MSSTDTNLKTLSFIQASGTALTQAQKLAEVVNTEKQAAAQLAGSVVEALVQNRLIQDHERDNAFRKLASHDGSIEVLQNLLGYLGQQKVAMAKRDGLNQGSGVDKTASADGTSPDDVRTNIVVGSKAGLGEKRASDNPFRRLAGLPEY